MLESTGNSKHRDALLEKLRERIKERDRALEVKHIHLCSFHEGNSIVAVVVVLRKATRS